jgi:hypothetical protein
VVTVVGRISASVVKYNSSPVNPWAPVQPDVWVQVRKVRPFRWQWHLTAGLAGPTIYGPFYALTENWARAKAVIAANSPKRKADR